MEAAKPARELKATRAPMNTDDDSRESVQWTVVLHSLGLANGPFQFELKKCAHHYATRQQENRSIRPLPKIRT